jgi:hypothetical protein
MRDNKKFFQSSSIISLGILLSINFFASEPLTTDYSKFKDAFAQGGHGRNLPPSIIGDREISLHFNNQIDSTTKKI